MLNARRPNADTAQDMKLLDGQFEPLTWSVGFVEAPVWRLTHQLLTHRPAQDEPARTRRLTGPLGDMLGGLDPLSDPHCRQALLATRSPWTAYFTNSFIGAQPVPEIAAVTEQLRCRGLVVQCCGEPGLLNCGGEWASLSESIQFHLFGTGDRTLRPYERTVSVRNDDGRWIFMADGAVQAFEQLDRYEAPAVADRFTARMLADYCGALGIDLFDAGFYGPRGVLIARAPKPGAETSPLADWPWRPRVAV